MMDSNLQRLQELQVLDSRVAGLERKLEAIPTRIHGIRDGLQQAKASVDTIRGKLDGARKDIRTKERSSSTRPPSGRSSRPSSTRSRRTRSTRRRWPRSRARRSKRTASRRRSSRSWSSRSGSGARWSRPTRGSARRRRRRRSRRPPPPRSCAPSRWTSRPRGASEKSVVRDVPRDLLVQYARLLKGRAGLAVALVGSNGICSGCRVTLTPQRFNEVRQSSQILVCENCGRFLYYQP